MKALLSSHLQDVSQSKMIGDVASMHMYRDWVVRTCLFFVVDTTIFLNKAKNYVDLTYLLYLTDIEIISMYVWGPVAVSFLYMELSNTVVPKCEYLAM
jgi:hypothetical protein